MAKKRKPQITEVVTVPVQFEITYTKGERDIALARIEPHQDSFCVSVNHGPVGVTCLGIKEL